MNFKITFILLLFLINGCIVKLPDYFIDLPPKPFMMGVLRPGFSAEVLIGYSNNIGNGNHLDTIKDAKVSLFVNGIYQEEMNFMNTLSPGSNGRSSKFVSNYILNPYDVIKVHATFTDGTIIYATETVIAPISISIIDSTRNGGDISYRLLVPDAGFYAFMGPYENGFGNSGDYPKQSPDPAHLYSKSALRSSPFAVIPYENYTYKLNYNNLRSQTKNYLIFRVYKYSNPAEQFIRDQEKNYLASGGEFSNYTSTFTNVSNGIGILYSETFQNLNFYEMR